MSKNGNIVVIFTDQLRRQSLGCYGDPNVETPTIDSLADEGVQFENACSTYPVCVPTRFTLMTGEYAHSRAVPVIDWRMSPAERTIADEFADAGYQTAYVGKWHLSGTHMYRYSDVDDDASPSMRVRPSMQGGFEHWRGVESSDAEDDTIYFVDDDPNPQMRDQYHTDGYFDLASEFIERERDFDRPFFLVVSVNTPHPPYVAPEPYMECWRGRDVELRPNVELDREYPLKGPDSETFLDDVRAYYAMIENIDDNVGRLVSTLDSAGIRDETTVVFLSDHGEMLGSHGLIGKQHPYEESTGVPLIVSHHGGGIDEGRSITDPVCTEDWLPTLLGLAGIQPQESKPGEDLTPLLCGRRVDLDRDGVLLELVREDRPGGPYAEETYRGIRTARYKYTIKGAIGGEPWQLFDLEEDPCEETNLLDRSERRELATELHGQLRRRLVESGDDYVMKPAFGYEGLNIGVR